MLKRHLLPYVHISYVFLIFGALFGLVYSLQMVGLFQELIRPDIARSLHISLMLYGFAPLMLSLLPFVLFEKEGLDLSGGLPWLKRYFAVWFVFLVFMMLSLFAGVSRGLPFYDFPYELNGLLAFSGLFYLVAILKIIKGYAVKPLWVKVSLAVVTVAPFALLLLMNPDYGQVEQMHLGPHGDNTLGMSFAMLVIYYLAIKLHAKEGFAPRRHLLWMIPLGFYALSVLYRSFVGSLSYEAEWFLQYLTLLFLPMLYTWWKDAGLSIRENLALFISIAAFVFADVEGNILFIPELRHLFHRNDLVVGIMGAHFFQVHTGRTDRRRSRPYRRGAGHALSRLRHHGARRQALPPAASLFDRGRRADGPGTEPQRLHAGGIRKFRHGDDVAMARLRRRALL